MKYIVILVFVLITSWSAFSQEKVSFQGKVDAEGVDREQLRNDLNSWFDGQSTFKNLLNTKQDTITGKGHFPYSNSVVFGGSKTISREYQKMTKGMFTYAITFYVEDNKYTYVISEFTHWPSETVDYINFGVLYNQETLPESCFCDVDEKWCTDVWNDMRGKAKDFVPGVIKSMPYMK
jgi:hypothetical protein